MMMRKQNLQRSRGISKVSKTGIERNYSVRITSVGVCEIAEAVPTKMRASPEMRSHALPYFIGCMSATVLHSHTKTEVHSLQ